MHQQTCMHVLRVSAEQTDLKLTSGTLVLLILLPKYPFTPLSLSTTTITGIQTTRHLLFGLMELSPN